MITPNAKYNPPKPQIAIMNAILPINEENAQEETGQKDEGLNDPKISAARATIGTTNTTSDKSPYTPTRCKTYRLPQKNCHQVMKTIHDTDDPKKCFFVYQNKLQTST